MPQKMSEAQENAYSYLKNGYRIYWNITGSDPVYDKDEVLVSRITNLGTMANLISRGLVKVVNYEYILTNDTP